VVAVKDESGAVIAEVEKLLHVRKRADEREQLRRAEERNPRSFGGAKDRLQPSEDWQALGKAEGMED
jgi:hypothetical protein